MAPRLACSPPASSAGRSALAGSFSSIEANRQVSPILRSRRTIAAARLISSADSGSSGCELVTRSSWLMAEGQAKILAARVARALRFGHAQCGSDDGVDD